jgi:nitrate reductase gamma subunit
MEVYLYLLVYVSVLVFLAAVAARASRIRNYPLNVRWELYPVPHEGKRALHGGSKMEEVDWHKKEHPKDKVMELRFMLAEMIFIKALKEHNPKLWRFSFPFHFGLYMSAAFAALVVLLAVLGLLGVEVGDPAPMAVALLGVIAFGLVLVGCLGLLVLRLTDTEMTPYTHASHVFNLLFIGATVGLLLAVVVNAGLDVGPFTAFVTGLMTFRAQAAPPEPLVTASIVSSAVLLAYIPLTHMSHFFVKWFTWHHIRWDDEHNVRGGRIEKMIEQALQYPVSWSADHIGGDGKKTWADVATEEVKAK